MIAPFWFQRGGRKSMLLPADPRPWPGCQPQGWVGAAEGSRPLPAPAPRPRPLHIRGRRMQSLTREEPQEVEI